MERKTEAKMTICKKQEQSVQNYIKKMKREK